MKRLLILFITLFFSFQCFAQTASPSLDPTQKNDLPSVTPWRYFSTIAGSYGTGESKMETSDKKEEGTLTNSGALVALNLEGFGVEAIYDNLTAKIEEEDSDTDFTVTSTALSLSYLLSDYLSIGVGQIYL